MVLLEIREGDLVVNSAGPSPLFCRLFLGFDVEVVGVVVEFLDVVF